VRDTRLAVAQDVLLHEKRISMMRSAVGPVARRMMPAWPAHILDLRGNQGGRPSE